MKSRDYVEEKLKESYAVRDRMFADYNQLLGMIAAFEEILREDES